MVAEAEAKLAAQQEKNPKKGGGDKGGRFASVSAHFLGQLNQLTTTVRGSSAQFGAILRNSLDATSSSLYRSPRRTPTLSAASTPTR